MSNLDLVAMIGNISQSLPAVEALIGGFSYLLGVVFVFHAFNRFKEMLEGSSAAKPQIIVPVAYFLAGAGMFFLPTLMNTFSSTLFGSSTSVLAYSSVPNPYDIYNSIGLLVQTAGIIWFLRGCVLLAHASHPEQGQEGIKGVGPKGFLFIVAGIFAINFHSSVTMVDAVVNYLTSLMSTPH